MDQIERRAFMRGAGFGALAFTVGGVEVLLTPGRRGRKGVPLRTLTADAGRRRSTRSGETLVPGAREAGDHTFRRSADLDSGGGGTARGAHSQRPPALCEFLPRGARRDRSREPSAERWPPRSRSSTRPSSATFVDNMRQNKIEGWQGPSGGFVYTVLRSDAVDVVYGTMDGYAALGIPYMAHIAPTKRW